MSRTASFYDLRDALALPGCPVCRLAARDAGRYLDGLLWEHVTDPGVRAKVRRAQGFCRDHARLLDRAGASLGVAILMQDLLRGVLETLEGVRFQAPPALSRRRAQETLDPGQPSAATAELVARLTPEDPCPACAHASEGEAGYLDTLVEQLPGEEGLLDAYRGSAGLCLPHFRMALARVREPAVFEALVSAQRGVWERLEAGLREQIRKNDHRFRDEPWGDESDAWLRGLVAVSGGAPLE